MTSSQIKYILKLKGFNTDEWTTLYKEGATELGVVGLSGDNNLVVDPTCLQFFFDTTNELLYTKRYYGRPYTVKDDLHTIKVTFNNKDYYCMPKDGQIYDKVLGYVCEAVDFSVIVAFYPQEKSVFSNY